MVLTKKSLLNIAFAVWLASELFFQHTRIAQISLLVFCIVIIACIHGMKFNVFIGSFFLFICWSVINIVTEHTIDASISWAMTTTLIINFVFLFLFSQYYRYIGDIKVIMRLFSSVVLIFATICLIIGFGTVMSFGRMYINGINANTAAYYAVYACLWSFYLAVFKEKMTFRNLFALLIYISFVLMTGSRGAFFSLMIGMYLLFIAHNKSIMILKIILVTLITVLVLFLVMKVDILYTFIGNRIEPLFERILTGSFEEASLSSRIQYIRLAFSASTESLFWGHGLDCFRCLSGSYGTYSHNNYAEILFSLGLTGFILYYFPYIMNLRYYLVSIFKKSNETVAISSFILIYLISEPFRVTYFNRAFLILPLICYLYMADEKRRT